MHQNTHEIYKLIKIQELLIYITSELSHILEYITTVTNTGKSSQVLYDAFS